MARKLVTQVWHLLWGNPPTALESDPSLVTKFKKLAVMLGKDLRAKLGLPTNLQTCVVELLKRVRTQPTIPEDQPCPQPV